MNILKRMWLHHHYKLEEYNYDGQIYYKRQRQCHKGQLGYTCHGRNFYKECI